MILWAKGHTGSALRMRTDFSIRHSEPARLREFFFRCSYSARMRNVFFFCCAAQSSCSGAAIVQGYKCLLLAVRHKVLVQVKLQCKDTNVFFFCCAAQSSCSGAATVQRYKMSSSCCAAQSSFSGEASVQG